LQVSGNVLAVGIKSFAVVEMAQALINATTPRLTRNLDFRPDGRKSEDFSLART
jgi:hypothetical protein